jgi:UDP-N-acetylmuramoyl-tripeptide--D-alanyl-D-alanine ligase
MFNLKVEEIQKAIRGRLICKGKRKFISGVSTDTRTIKEGDLFIALKGRNFDGHDFINKALEKGAAGVIQLKAQSPQLKAHSSKPTAPACQDRPKEAGRHSPATIIQVTDTLKALGNIAHHYRIKFKIPFIGITGSNGKTTTKEMVFRVLSSGFRVLKNDKTENNIIGLSKALLGLSPDYDIGVLELGTNHFGEIKILAGILRPTVGIITNIGSAHLEFLKSKQGAFKEKAELLGFLGRGDTAILNADDPFLAKIEGLKPNGIRFGIDNNCDFKATKIFYRNEETEFIVNKKYSFRLRSLGRYNVYNALAAITAGFFYKMDYSDIYSALLEFEPLNGRLRLKRLGAFDIMDDTYNSNPTSLKSALEVLSSYKTAGRKIVICGDMLELGSSSVSFHREAGRLVYKAGVDCLISVGKFSKVIAAAAVDSGMDKGMVFSCKDNPGVLSILRDIIKEGDLVFLKGSRLIRLEEVINALSSFVPAKGDMVRV